jgi:hypothetical protein
MALAFVPPPDEQHPAIAVLKVTGMTAAILAGGAAIYFTGRARARASTAPEISAHMAPPE